MYLGKTKAKRVLYTTCSIYLLSSITKTLFYNVFYDKIFRKIKEILFSDLFLPKYGISGSPYPVGLRPIFWIASSWSPGDIHKKSGKSNVYISRKAFNRQTDRRHMFHGTFVLRAGPINKVSSIY